jgi:DNA-binding PadR family transcriptional regulator
VTKPAPSAPKKKLTPTSYAILGLLSRRPWSAYELNKHMQTSMLRAFWPRTESHVYSEPKKLAAQGLATGRTEENEGRKRTVYHITRAGKDALEEWLRAPVRSYVATEFEAMVKFLHADAGQPEDMRATLQAILDGALVEAEAIAAGIRFEDDPERPFYGLPFNGVAINLLIDLLEARLAWAEDARELLAELTSTTPTADNTRLGNAQYDRARQRLADLLDKYGAQD